MSTSERPIVTVTRRLPIPVEIEGAEVRTAGPERLSRDELSEFVRGASVIISMFHDPMDAQTFDAAGPQLLGVCNDAVGYDNIDLGECARRGIRVANTPDAVTEGTANMAMALLLAGARRVIEGDRMVRSGRFTALGPMAMDDMMGVPLTGQTLLIVGAGRIGKAVALRALGFGMRIAYVARSRKLDFELAPIAARRVELDEGLREADFVSIHCPLTDETRGLINAERLRMLKPTAVLINTARGPIVDEGALVEALREGRLFAAGLDVYEHEPRVHEGLINLENAVLTPHIGSAETRYRALMVEMCMANARAMLAGQRPPNLVEA